MPESARLLFHSPTYWAHHLDQEDAIVATVNLQRDSGVMSSNLQILGIFVTSLEQMSSEVLHLAMGQMVFPSSEVAALSLTPHATQRWQLCLLLLMLRRRPTIWRRLDNGDLRWARVDPGPGNACMNCSNCLLAGSGHPRLDIIPRYGGPVCTFCHKTLECSVTNNVL